MKKLSALLLNTAFLISVYSSGAPAQKRVTQISLLTTGEFHGGEVTAESGERWLGLFPNGGGAELSPVTLRVEAAHDPLIDNQPGEKTGKEVGVNDERVPLFLLKGADFLRPGDVPTLASEPRNLENGDDIALTLGGHSYRIRVSSDDPAPANGVRQNSRLVLTSGGTSQVLFSVQGHDDGEWALLWAGDLDGDGRLDLFMDLSDHYNASHRRLFLSTRARGGALVREVAQFVTVGC